MPPAEIRAKQTIQEGGNGLAVRLTAPIARAARLVKGTSVMVEVVEEGVLRVIGKPRRTLAQKLKAFNPARHGGESAVSSKAGA